MFIDNLMKYKKKFYTSGIALLLLVIMFVASTYAYFKSTDASDSGFDTSVSTNTTDSLVFETGGDISITANPSNFNEGMGNQSGSTFARATLKANNKTNFAKARYYLYLDILENDFEYSYDVSHRALVMKWPEILLQVIDPDGNEVTELNGLRYVTPKDGQDNKISGFDITVNKGLVTIASDYEITSTNEAVQEWQIKVIFLNLGWDQSINGGKKFNAKLRIQKDKDINDLGESPSLTFNKMVSRNFIDSNELIWQYKDKIKNIFFESILSKPTNSIEIDMSLENNGSVMAYLIDNGDDTYDAHIQANGKILANSNFSYFFEGFTILETINGAENIDTHMVTKMSGMFWECSKLTNVDVGSWNTSSVTDMSYMFNTCTDLTNIDVSGWDTSSVTDMKHMFSGCSGLTSLNVSNFNTSSVTDMSYMFNGCKGLTNLNVGNFDTSEVTNMSYMFSFCNDIQNINGLDLWDISKVTDISSMFIYSYSLKDLQGIKNWNPSNVITMKNMFVNSGLTSLDVSTWNIDKLSDISGMFENSSLVSVDLSGWNTSKITSMSGLFKACSSLEYINLSGWDTSNLINMSETFKGCEKLKTLDFRSATFNTDIPNIQIFHLVPTSVNVIVKDEAAKNFIEGILGNGVGTVTIA